MLEFIPEHHQNEPITCVPPNNNYSTLDFYLGCDKFNIYRSCFEHAFLIAIDLDAMAAGWRMHAG